MKLISLRDCFVALTKRMCLDMMTKDNLSNLTILGLSKLEKTDR